MVREVVTPAALLSDPKNLKLREPAPRAEHEGLMTDAASDPSRDPLRCEELLPASPDMPTSDSYVEYDDLPDLQEVQGPAAPPVYRVEAGVSHQETRARCPRPPDAHWLTQLAHIATGPQSPLLQETARSSTSLVCISSGGSDLHSYARPPPTPPLPFPGSTSSAPRGERRRSRIRLLPISLQTSSECGSAVSARSSLSVDEDMRRSFAWPPTAWHCFLKGTHLRFHSGGGAEWQDAGELDSAEEDACDGARSGSLKSYGSEGLRLVEQSEVALAGQAVLQLTFDPGAFGPVHMTARCQLDHPFYVKDKGWSSLHPSLTAVHFGIPCHAMEVGDVCLPAGHRDANHTGGSPVLDSVRSYDFTPLDLSAVYVLSSMARRRRASQSSGGAASPERDGHSPGHSRSPQPKPTRSEPAGAQAGSDAGAAVRCKRPMNAFMLFAKKFRVHYTQMHPGKDNRAISVLLGERWKKMCSEERRVFTLQAKALADEQKRLNPDCWKRKRTNSGCQGN